MCSSNYLLKEQLYKQRIKLIKFDNYTQELLIILPPQIKPPLNLSTICHGQALLYASVPPTILSCLPVDFEIKIFFIIHSNL